METPKLDLAYLYWSCWIQIKNVWFWRWWIKFRRRFLGRRRCWLYWRYGWCLRNDLLTARTSFNVSLTSERLIINYARLSPFNNYCLLIFNYSCEWITHTQTWKCLLSCIRRSALVNNQIKMFTINR